MKIIITNYQYLEGGESSIKVIINKKNVFQILTLKTNILGMVHCTKKIYRNL